MAEITTSSSSVPGPAAMSPRSARRSWASRPRSSSARIWAASASTGAASRPRRCCARPRCSTTCSHADSFGLSKEKPSFDLAKVVARSRAVAKQLNQGVTHLMKKNKIAVHMGEGKLTAPGKMTVTGADGKKTELAAKHIIIATGARARDLPFAKADGKKIWTYRHAMTPPEMPTELLVIGSGAIGIEFASFYNDMGAKVTVVEMLDRVVPVEDAEVSDFLAKSLAKQGMTILHRRGRREPEGRRQGRRGEDQDQGRQGRASSASATASSRSASLPNTENIGLEKARRENHQGPYRHRPHVPHQRAGHLGDRRRHRAALAGAQGEPRGRHRGRGDRPGARQQGRPSARDGPARTSRAAPIATRRSPASA